MFGGVIMTRAVVRSYAAAAEADQLHKATHEGPVTVDEAWRLNDQAVAAAQEVQEKLLVGQIGVYRLIDDDGVPTMLWAENDTAMEAGHEVFVAGTHTWSDADRDDHQKALAKAYAYFNTGYHVHPDIVVSGLSSFLLREIDGTDKIRLHEMKDQTAKIDMVYASEVHVKARGEVFGSRDEALSAIQEKITANFMKWRMDPMKAMSSPGKEGAFLNALNSDGLTAAAGGTVLGGVGAMFSAYALGATVASTPHLGKMIAGAVVMVAGAAAGVIGKMKSDKVEATLEDQRDIAAPFLDPHDGPSQDNLMSGFRAKIRSMKEKSSQADIAPPLAPS